jgi:hypothetical protein
MRLGYYPRLQSLVVVAVSLAILNLLWLGPSRLSRRRGAEPAVAFGKWRSPLVVTFVMRKERRHPRISNHTIDKLTSLNWELLVADAVNGPAIGREGIEQLADLRGVSFDPDITNPNFARRNVSSKHSYLAQLGAFASHQQAWALAAKLGRPIVSLEADVVPVLPWPRQAAQLFGDSDFLCLHEHNRQTVHCNPRRPHSIPVEGACWAAGAMLVTGRDTDLLSRALRAAPLNKPVDHWLAAMSRTGVLRIGTLCPPLFYQSDRHTSMLTR